jgi:Fe2+ or Zn2+ uptake regulation protein
VPNPPDLISTLSLRGVRLTGARRAVIAALLAEGRPVTARELHARVRAVDLVTVYRTLAWLVEQGVARRVSAVAGAERFEPVPEDAHAHHLHCDRCGGLTTVPECGLDPATAARILREHGFEVAAHTLTFHGRCAACRRGDGGSAPPAAGHSAP